MTKLSTRRDKNINNILIYSLESGFHGDFALMTQTPLYCAENINKTPIRHSTRFAKSLDNTMLKAEYKSVFITRSFNRE